MYKGLSRPYSLAIKGYSDAGVCAVMYAASGSTPGIACVRINVIRVTPIIMKDSEASLRARYFKGCEVVSPVVDPAYETWEPEARCLLPEAFVTGS